MAKQFGVRDRAEGELDPVHVLNGVWKAWGDGEVVRGKGVQKRIQGKVIRVYPVIVRPNSLVWDAIAITDVEEVNPHHCLIE